MSTVPAIALGAYGKLPVSKEYLRLRCGSGGGGAFYQWINQGYDHSVRNGREREPRVGGPWNLLFYPEGMGEAVVARLRDSADSGGLRRFPFSCFTGVPAAELNGDPDDQVRRIAPLWQALESIDAKLTECADLAELKEAFKGAELPTLPQWVSSSSALTDIDLVEYARRLTPAQDPLDELGGILFRLASAVGTLAAGVIRGARLPGLRVPLTPEFDLIPQALAWLSCLETGGFLSGRKSPVSIAIPARADGPTSMWILIRPPLPSDFTMLGAPHEGVFFPALAGSVRNSLVETEAQFLARADRRLFAGGATLSDLASFSLGV